MKILLRYRAHYLANEICKILDFPQQLKNRVYIDWSICKVESLENDDIIFGLIKEKLKELKDISYTEIAHKAINIGKNNLAIKLLGKNIQYCL